LRGGDIADASSLFAGGESERDEEVDLPVPVLAAIGTEAR